MQKKIYTGAYVSYYIYLQVATSHSWSGNCYGTKSRYVAWLLLRLLSLLTRLIPIKHQHHSHGLSFPSRFQPHLLQWKLSFFVSLPWHFLRLLPPWRKTALCARMALLCQTQVCHWPFRTFLNLLTRHVGLLNRASACSRWIAPHVPVLSELLIWTFCVDALALSNCAPCAQMEPHLEILIYHSLNWMWPART